MFGKMKPEGLTLQLIKSIACQVEEQGFSVGPGLLQGLLESFRGTEELLAITMTLPLGEIKTELENVHTLYNPNTQEAEAGE